MEGSYEVYESMKKSTMARICVGRAGARYKTKTLLKLRADHAVAMDAVWSYVDEVVIDKLKFLKVQTLVKIKKSIYKDLIWEENFQMKHWSI